MEIVSYKVAKAIKKAGYPQGDGSYDWGQPFYTTARSKMYGIDDHGWPYPIVNRTGRLYHVGEESVQNQKNFIIAPYYYDVWKWLWTKKKQKIAISDGWDTETYAYVGEGEDARKFTTFDPEAAIIRAIDYMVDNDMIK